jgi:hypothetical protein
LPLNPICWCCQIDVHIGSLQLSSHCIHRDPLVERGPLTIAVRPALL